jgi:hypothetical protein
LALSIRTQIGDERAVPTNSRDPRIAELELEFARDDADIALAKKDDAATLEQLEARLDRLRQLRDRIDQRQLEPEDWALLRALIREEMT